MKENDTNSKVGAICLPPETKSIITSQIDSINYSIAIPIEDHYASQLTLVRGTISVDKVGKGFVINRSAPNGDGFMYKYHNIKDLPKLKKYFNGLYDTIEEIINSEFEQQDV